MNTLENDTPEHIEEVKVTVEASSYPHHLYIDVAVNSPGTRYHVASKNDNGLVCEEHDVVHALALRLSEDYRKRVYTAIRQALEQHLEAPEE